MKYTLRTLLKRPLFTLIAVLTLAIGIGANTAIFSFINAVLLKPLPYAEPERLIALRSNLSFLNLQDVRATTQTLDSLSGMTMMPRDYTGGSEPMQALAGLVTADFFNLLGVQPAIGRVITPGDERVVVLTDSFWKQVLNGDPSIVGRTIPLSGETFTIIGVMPPDFLPPRDQPDMYMNLQVGYQVATQHRGVHFLRSYARLKPGITLAQAQAEMPLIDRKLAEIDPAENKNRRMVLMPLQERIVGESRRGLMVLFGAVALVLLVACTNFANLLLARASEREQEVVVRSALGAGRGRIIRELLTESVLLSLLGGVAGLALAFWSLDLLKLLSPEDLPRIAEVKLDGMVLAFTFLVSLMTGVLFGLAPAWQASRATLRESGRSLTASRSRQRLRSVLVVAEIAIALVLLAAAGLLIRSLFHLRSVSPGFDVEGLTKMRIELPETRYADIPSQTRYRESILETINTLPGTRAAMISEAPLTGRDLHHDFLVEGQQITPGDEPSLYSRSVMGDYFKVMGMPLLAGRDLTPDDRSGMPAVGVVNQAMVSQYFRNENPVGKRIRWARSSGPPRWIEIVGVVGDVRHFGLDRQEEPAIYWPYAQSDQNWKRWMDVVVRHDASGIGAIKKQIWSVDPQVPLTKVASMGEVTSRSVATRQFQMLLLTVFSIIAVLLAAIGIYGVMSQSVTQRTHEIGIRLALGAQERNILGMVIRRGAILTGAGIAIGVLAAIALSKVIESLLYEVTARDPATLLIVGALLGLVALIACLVPALRASKVDPMVALRYE